MAETPEPAQPNTTPACFIFGAGPFYGLDAPPAPGDLILAADGGYRHCCTVGLQPHLLLGDFDSLDVPPPQDIPRQVFPPEKDDTDTVFAVTEALRRGFEDFLLVGAAGGRLDHTLANVSILLMLHRQGKSALLVDDWSEMEVVGAEPVHVDGSFPFFSLLNVSGTARGVTVEDARYPLRDAEIRCTYQYGVSNEALPGRRARVRVGEGELLLVRVRQEDAHTARPAGAAE